MSNMKYIKSLAFTERKVGKAELKCLQKHPKIHKRKAPFDNFIFVRLIFRYPKTVK